MRLSGPRRTWFTGLSTALLALALAGAALAQSKSDKWVTTWTTALVSRPLPGPRAGGPGGPPVAPAIVVPPSGTTIPAPATPPAPAAPAAGPGGGGGGRGFAPPA